ncbi:hypothetical protein GCM10011583_72240 [Streptomyces camponoticapitis]|uniref:Uncharacterized protein n=1 Tax=Streptomyces camponoticapitis TaxID=1616125 RepID=A0ABQ2EWZ1_9ACTN|nr:hypothetical protein [Streptomyces camponoticapitis]GGK29923.1 hypothetical protein GCM10011583_72240 [Streptomyces camponoticapitis]
MERWSEPDDSRQAAGARVGGPEIFDELLDSAAEEMRRHISRADGENAFPGAAGSY